MGTTALFTLLSIRPEYNAKIKLGICLAPIAIWEEISPVLKYLHNSNKIPKIKVKRYQNHYFKRNNVIYI